MHRHVTHAEYYARVADLYHSNKNALGYENVQLKLESLGGGRDVENAFLFL